MSELFSYKHIKENLTGKSYYWESNYEIIDQIIPNHEKIIAYPKKLSNDTEKEIYFFSEASIFKLTSKNDKIYKLIMFKIVDIRKLILDIQNGENITLIVKFQDEDIELSSSDSIGDHHKNKYADAILKIAKLFSN